jgi:hypothetical protein
MLHPPHKRLKNFYSKRPLALTCDVKWSSSENINRPWITLGLLQQKFEQSLGRIGNTGIVGLHTHTITSLSIAAAAAAALVVPTKIDCISPTAAVEQSKACVRVRTNQ